MSLVPAAWSALVAAAMLALASPVSAENEGIEDLDRATQLKVAAQSVDDLGKVIDQIELAIEKGLDMENNAFAEELLVSTLMQRATMLSGVVLNPAQQLPRNQWVQLRQYALNDLQRVLDMDRTYWEAYLLLGRLQATPLGDQNAARRAFTAIINAADVSPEQRAEALALRGVVQRDPELRLEDFHRAIELEPESVEYRLIRARHYFAEEEFEAALTDIDRTIELEPDNAGNHELRGMILLGLDRHEDALASFDRATELRPEAALPYQHRGELFRKQGNLEQALEQLGKALELAPDSVPTLLIRAGVYYEVEEPEKALEDVEHAIRVQPHLLLAHLMRAEIYAATDRLEEAIAHLEQLAQLAPGQPQVLNPLAMYYLVAGRPSKAITTLDEVIAIDPEDSRALRFRGDAYLNVGKHPEAIADFERALALDPENDGLLNNFAWVLATSPTDELRDGRRALELATKASELTGYQTPHILSTLAAAYAEIGDFESAVKWAEKAVEAQQKAIDMSDDEEALERLRQDMKQLEEEVASYRDEQPWRELQTADEEEPDDSSPASDAAAD